VAEERQTGGEPAVAVPPGGCDPGITGAGSTAARGARRDQQSAPVPRTAAQRSTNDRTAAEDAARAQTLSVARRARPGSAYVA